MGLLLRALVERLWSSAAQAIPCAVTVCGPVPLRARVLNQMRFLVPGADGAVLLVTCRRIPKAGALRRAERNR